MTVKYYHASVTYGGTSFVFAHDDQDPEDFRVKAFDLATNLDRQPEVIEVSAVYEVRSQ